MSHHLLSKRILISVIVLTCTFLGLAYTWLYYTDQWIERIDLRAKGEASPKAADEQNEFTHEADEAAYYTEKPLDESEIQENHVEYPLILQVQQGEIGLYTQQNDLIRKLDPVGELLSENDQKRLQQGIQIENERDLIMVLESYHLQ